MSSDPVLNSQTNQFATNHHNCIIAWTNLHQHINEDLIKSDGNSTGLWKISLRKGDESLDHRFEIVQKIDTNTVLQYSNVLR